MVVIKSFCDQNLQSVATSVKKLKIVIFIFFDFDSSFFQNIFHCNIPLGHDFPMMLSSSNSFKRSES